MSIVETVSRFARRALTGIGNRKENVNFMPAVKYEIIDL